jgi:hypothetical protein
VRVKLTRVVVAKMLPAELMLGPAEFMLFPAEITPTRLPSRLHARPHARPAEPPHAERRTYEKKHDFDHGHHVETPSPEGTTIRGHGSDLETTTQPG